QKKQAEFAMKLADIEVTRLEALAAHSTASKESPGSGGTGKSLPLVSRIEMDKARVALEDARSKLKALEDQLQFYTLAAPIKGRLGRVAAVPGQTLAAGTAVAEVIDLEEIDVLCYVPPAVIGRLTLNQPARLKVGTNHSEAEATEGRIVYIAVQAQA